MPTGSHVKAVDATGNAVRVVTNAGVDSGAEQQIMTLADSAGNLLGTTTAPLPVAMGGQLYTVGLLTNAAGATGTMTAVDVSKAGNASFIVFNTTAATVWTGSPVVVFEQSYDSTSWAPLQVRRETDGAVATTFTLTPLTANAALVFDTAVESVLFVRCRITTAQATASMSIVCVPGAQPFSPVVSVAASSEQRASTLAVTATAAAGSAATATLPAVAGSFHYITAITIDLYSSAARTGAAAAASVTTTNLPGSLAFTFTTAGAIGTSERQTLFPTTPLKSSAANTNTTIVAALTTGGIWRITVTYFTGP